MEGTKILKGGRGSARFVLLAAAMTTLMGCWDQEKKTDALADAKIKINSVEVLSNSPDNAVRSWWAIKDAGLLLIKAQCEQYIRNQKTYIEKLGSVSEFPMPDRDCSIDKYDRSILKVDVESETRAIVYARILNSTAPDPGAALDSSDEKRKKEGERYRYTLGRKSGSSGWAITVVENFPSWERDWTNVNPESEPSAHTFVNANYQ